MNPDSGKRSSFPSVLDSHQSEEDSAHTLTPQFLPEGQGQNVKGVENLAKLLRHREGFSSLWFSH